MEHIPGHSICAVACTLSRDHAPGRPSYANEWFGELGHAIVDILIPRGESQSRLEVAGVRPDRDLSTFVKRS